MKLRLPLACSSLLKHRPMLEHLCIFRLDDTVNSSYLPNSSISEP
jgi:hypothetical protein